MDTCFLFTEYLNDTGCFCFKLAADGTLKTPPASLNFSEIKTLQQDSHTILVEPCTQATIMSLELPWLPERKARAAIPYALEDKLAQSVEELHFAFDKLRYHNNHYMIFVIAKQRMQYLMQQMSQHAIEFESITLDWFALDERQSCITDTHLLVNEDDFKGALSGALARSYLKQSIHEAPLLFQNSASLTEQQQEQHDEIAHIWIAKRLLNSNPLNLCQGDMRHGTTSDWTKKGCQLIALACGVWLTSIIVVNAIQLQILNKKNAEINGQIAVIYHRFFPEAKQVISPKFRISQLLGNNQKGSQARFWFLLNELANTMKNNMVSIEQMRYQNKTLSITVISPDFATLEHLEDHLKKASLKVNQIEASTHDQQVIATLELM